MASTIDTSPSFVPIEHYGTNFGQGEILEFDLGGRGEPDSTQYNPSVPFRDIFKGECRTLIMLRHENLYSETDSEVVVCDHDTRRIVPNAPVFAHMQDPFYMGRFRDENDELYHVIGGVKITVGGGKVTGWQDTFYRYKNSIMELSNRDTEPEPWLVGIPNWKDTRATQLLGGIAVMPRPQGVFGGAGNIGSFETKHLGTFAKDLQRYAAAQDTTTLIQGLFTQGQWGGANQLSSGPNGTLIVDGHTAHFNTERLKEYQSMRFTIDWLSKKLVSDVKIIATADHFPALEPKPGHGLSKVHFTAGRVACNDGTGASWLYGGVQDRAASRLKVS